MPRTIHEPASGLLLVELKRARVAEVRHADRAGQRDMSRERQQKAEVRVAQTEEERAVVWKGRKAAFAAVGASPPTTLCRTAWCPAPGAPKF